MEFGSAGPPLVVTMLVVAIVVPSRGLASVGAAVPDCTGAALAVLVAGLSAGPFTLMVVGLLVV